MVHPEKKPTKSKTRQNKLNHPIISLKIRTLDSGVLTDVCWGRQVWERIQFSLSLSLSTHTHTHTVGERENVKLLTIVVRKCVEIFLYENKDGGSVNVKRYKTDIHHEH